MKKQNIKKFINKINEIQEDGTLISDYLKNSIYHMVQHDDLRDEHGFKNTAFFLQHLEEAFKELDG